MGAPPLAIRACNKADVTYAPLSSLWSESRMFLPEQAFGAWAESWSAWAFCPSLGGLCQAPRNLPLAGCQAPAESPDFFCCHLIPHWSHHYVAIFLLSEQRGQRRIWLCSAGFSPGSWLLVPASFEKNFSDFTVTFFFTLVIIKINSIVWKDVNHSDCEIHFYKTHKWTDHVFSWGEVNGWSLLLARTHSGDFTGKTLGEIQRIGQWGARHTSVFISALRAAWCLVVNKRTNEKQMCRKFFSRYKVLQDFIAEYFNDFRIF